MLKVALKNKQATEYHIMTSLINSSHNKNSVTDTPKLQKLSKHFLNSKDMYIYVFLPLKSTQRSSDGCYLRILLYVLIKHR